MRPAVSLLAARAVYAALAALVAVALFYAPLSFAGQASNRSDGKTLSLIHI